MHPKANLKMKRTLFLTATFILILTNWRCTNDQATANLSVTWELISNIIDDEKTGCRAAFTITNNGSEILGNSGWAIYYNQTNRSVKSVEGNADIEQIIGDFYKISPKENFELKPGESTKITFDLSDWLIKESDAPHGIYLVKTDKKGKEIPAIIEDYKILPFTKPEQLNRHKNDFHAIVTPESRFIENENISLIEEPWVNFALIPAPFQFGEQEGTTTIDVSTKIHYQTGLENEARYLANRLKAIFKTEFEMVNTAGPGKNTIVLKIVPGVPLNGKVSESYVLRTKQTMTEIRGGDAAGIFYGIQSLLQLFPVDAYQTQPVQIQLPILIVADGPRFIYRGMHLDVARNFHDKNAVKKLIDAMSFYKLNKLHLHLTEDEGWRIEIKQLPELTQYGAFRGHDLNEENHLNPSYGSGPFADPTSSNGSGFYTQEDFIEILKYAKERHVEVIPEINVPGHARAAIKAMEARYRKLKSEGKNTEAEEYLLSDLDDKSEYLSVQSYPDNVVCPCRESVYKFYETVTEEIVEMYKTADVTLTTIHTGGDEVPAGVWEKSPLCEKFLSENEKYAKPYDLTYYFRERIGQIIAKHNLTMAGWEEIALTKTESGYDPNPEFLDNNFQPYVWNNLWGNQDLGYRLANAGYPTVLCNVTNLYFDLAYDKDPREPGFYWGGFVNTRKAVEFLPMNVFHSTSEDALGKPFNIAEDYKNMERLTPEGAKNIIGIQGQLWSETIKNWEMLEYYYMPKLMGLAQRAWSNAPMWLKIENDSIQAIEKNKSWNTFANIMGQKELHRLDNMFGGYNYRIPAPGVIIRDGKAIANCAIPGFTIRYERGGKEPTMRSPEYTSPVDYRGIMKFRVFNSKGRGSMVSTIGESPQLKD